MELKKKIDTCYNRVWTVSKKLTGFQYAMCAEKKKLSNMKLNFKTPTKFCTHHPPSLNMLTIDSEGLYLPKEIENYNDSVSLDLLPNEMLIRIIENFETLDDMYCFALAYPRIALLFGEFVKKKRIVKTSCECIMEFTKHCSNNNSYVSWMIQKLHIPETTWSPSRDSTYRGYYFIVDYKLTKRDETNNIIDENETPVVQKTNIRDFVGSCAFEALQNKHMVLIYLTNSGLLEINSDLKFGQHELIIESDILLDVDISNFILAQFNNIKIIQIKGDFNFRKLESMFPHLEYAFLLLNNTFLFKIREYNIKFKCFFEKAELRLGFYDKMSEFTDQIQMFNQMIKHVPIIENLCVRLCSSKFDPSTICPLRANIENFKLYFEYKNTNVNNILNDVKQILSVIFSIFLQNSKDSIKSIGVGFFRVGIPIDVNSSYIFGKTQKYFCAYTKLKTFIVESGTVDYAGCISLTVNSFDVCK